MTYSDVKELISIINSSALTSFELSIDNVSVKMSKNRCSEPVVGTQELNAAYQQPAPMPTAMPQMEQTAPSAVEEAQPVLPAGDSVKSPIVGTFYSSPGPDKAPFVSKGDKVKKGDIVCIVEAMKIMNEITSDYDGEVKEVLVETGQLVEYGQPLFIIG